VYARLALSKYGSRGITYVVEANGRVDALDGLGGHVQTLRLRLIVEERALDQTHTLGWTLTEDMIKEA
jgi:hypothetical protein